MMSELHSPRPTWPIMIFVGEDERKPFVVLGWFGIALGLILIGVPLVNGVMTLGDPALKAVIETQSAPKGPHRLYVEIALLAWNAMSALTLSAAALISAQLMFRRPIWTFLAPVRPPLAPLILLGVLVYALGYGIEIGVRVWLGETMASPLLDSDQSLADRWIYALLAPVFLSVAAVSLEGLFRGLLLQLSGAASSNGLLLCVLNGALFSGFGAPSSPAAFVSEFLFGASLAWSALRLGGLEFAVGGQIGALIVSAGSAQPSRLLFANAQEDWRSAAGAGGVALFSVLVVEILARRRSQKAAS